MSEKEKIPASLLKLNIDDPRQKQPVRTTINLSAEARVDLEWLAQKTTFREVFDTLCKNKQLIQFSVKLIKENKLEIPDKMIRKTYVMRKNTLSKLKRISKENKISRDALIEALISTSRIFIEMKNKETLEKHKKALDSIKLLEEEASDVRYKLDDILYDDDPILEEFSRIKTELEILVEHILAELESGEIIDSIY